MSLYLGAMEQARLKDPRGLIWRLDVPRSVGERMRGLLGRNELPAFTGMLLLNCHSIHTVRMRFALDVVFLDRELRVVDVRVAEPGRWWVRCAGTKHILEAPAGSGLRPGDVLERL